MPKSRRITLKKALDLAVKQFAGYHAIAVREYPDPLNSDHIIYSITLNGGNMVAIVGVKNNGGDIAWIAHGKKEAKINDLDTVFSI